MGRKEMEAVGMGCLFVDPLLQWFLISLRRNSNVNMTARLCTCVLYHCLHPLAPHTALPLLWALGHQPSFCSLSSLLSAWRRAKRLSPVSVPSPTQQPLARTGHSLSFTWGTVQQVLYLPFFITYAYIFTSLLLVYFVFCFVPISIVSCKHYIIWMFPFTFSTYQSVKMIIPNSKCLNCNISFAP